MYLTRLVPINDDDVIMSASTMWIVLLVLNLSVHLRPSY